MDTQNETQETAAENIQMPENETVAADGNIQPKAETTTPDGTTEGAENTQSTDFEQLFEANKDKVKQFLSELAGAAQKNEPPADGLAERIKELEEKEKLLNMRTLEMDTIKLLADKDIPANIVKLVLGTDRATTEQNIELFQKEFDIAVQAQVEKRLVGTTPRSGTGSFHSHSSVNESTKKSISSIFGRQ